MTIAKLKIALSVLSLTTLGSHAVPTSQTLAVEGAPISKNCNNFRLIRTEWFVADCLTGDGSTRLESSVYLPNRIANREGNLQFEHGGVYSSSCTGCQLVDGIKLNCICRRTTNPTNNATLNLGEHIRSYNGYLLTDLLGPPSVPTSPRPKKIPTDVAWNLLIGSSACYSPEGYCPDVPSDPVPSECPALGRAIISDNGRPYRCWVFRAPSSAPIWTSFRHMKLETVGAGWEVRLYDNLECQGNPMGVVDDTKCHFFEKDVLALSFKPLWNADYE